MVHPLLPCLFFLPKFQVWLAIATTLQNFDIQKKRNSEGDEILISDEYCDGLVWYVMSDFAAPNILINDTKRSHPLPFECNIAPRSPDAQNVLLEAAGKLL